MTMLLTRGKFYGLFTLMADHGRHAGQFFTGRRI
jgi:hypothetical protein